MVPYHHGIQEMTTSLANKRIIAIGSMLETLMDVTWDTSPTNTATRFISSWIVAFTHTNQHRHI